jgi:hypothetical protein
MAKNSLAEVESIDPILKLQPWYEGSEIPYQIRFSLLNKILTSKSPEQGLKGSSVQVFVVLFRLFLLI